MKNIGILFFNLIFSNIFGIFIWAYLARILGPEDFGKINFAMAIVAYFGIFINLGIPIFAVKKVSIKRDNLERLRRYVNYILSLRIILMLVVFSLLFLFTIFLNKPLQIKYLILFYGLALLSNVFYLDWAFQAIEKMEYMVLPSIISNLFYAVLLIRFIKSSEQLLLVPLFSFLGSIFGVIISIFIFLKIFGRFKIKFNINIFKRIITSSLPIGISGIMVSAFYQLPIVMLGFMRSNKEVGFYNAGYKLVFFLLTVITTYYSALFPITSYYYNKSLDYFNKIIRNTAKLMLIVALPLSFGGAILAGPLMKLIYGLKFMEGVVVLQILIWDVFLVYVGSIFGQGLLAAHKQKELSLISMLMFMICLVMNLMLIPILGIAGSALAILIAEIVGVLLQYWRISKVINISIYSLTLKPLFASLVMALTILILSDHSTFQGIILIPVGGCIYFLVLSLIRGVRKEEIIQVYNMVFPSGNKYFKR